MSTIYLLRQLIKITCVNAIKLNINFKGITLIDHKPYILRDSTKCLDSFNFVKRYYTDKKNIPVASYEEIKKLTHKSTQLLIDVREPKELEDTGKITVSINIPLDQLEQELGASTDNATFKAKYGRDKPDENSEIIFHCRSGKRSQKAAEFARTLGYQNIKNYLGSWLEWAEKEGLPK